MDAKTQKNQDKATKTKEQDDVLETTEALRQHMSPAQKREMRAHLQQAIAEARCKHCLVAGSFLVFSTEGRTRYLKCMACGRTGNKVAV